MSPLWMTMILKNPCDQETRGGSSWLLFTRVNGHGDLRTCGHLERADMRRAPSCTAACSSRTLKPGISAGYRRVTPFPRRWPRRDEWTLRQVSIFEAFLGLIFQPLRDGSDRRPLKTSSPPGDRTLAGAPFLLSTHAISWHDSILCS